ncbi:MAG: undecaprenyl diphosphate synthase [Cyanobacteria bacterium RYN_339]|nr:undecaprenyl diphosphate synthase [Cyanobacteria bacterium RYN_339]
MNQSGLHLAIIMDGNGRWAEQRGLPRPAGHRAGARAVRAVVEAAPALGIGTLTLYAFSADNWRRPPREVAALMGLLRRFAIQEAQVLAKADVRLSFIGRRDRLPGPMLEAMAKSEALTATGRSLHLRVAVDYSARDALLHAARHLAQAPAATREGFGALLGSPDVDLLVRTGGDQRLSDFLLWECAYAELMFLPVAWPDFGPADLAACVGDFRARDRRFGGLTAPAPASAR